MFLKEVFNAHQVCIFWSEIQGQILCWFIMIIFQD